MKVKATIIAAVGALVILLALSLSAGAVKPKYKTVSLGCSTGVLSTTVKNGSGVNIPENAIITVHGVEGDCTQTANGPLAKGKSMQFKGCAEPVNTCRASAKWELE